MNVVLICIDCLRRDRLSSDTAPYLVHLCRSRGVSLDNAYATAPWTYPSTHSILTGVYPHHHGARHDGVYRERVSPPDPGVFNDQVPTLFSLLEPKGYSTLGISTNYWALNEHCNYMGCRRILRSQKYERFCGTASAQWVVDTFIEEINKMDEKRHFFAYLHLMDLHRPFDLTAALQYAEPGAEVLDGIDDWDSRLSCTESTGTVVRFRTNKVKLYDGLIRYLDDQIRRLVRFLIERDLFVGSIIVITADHGEEFWEHEQFESQHYDCGRKTKERWLLGTGHGHTLFNELLHVPLLFINPPCALGESVQSAPVSTVDIVPTLLTFLGLDLCHSVDGRSLTQNILGREILAESILYGHERKAIIKDNIKVISAPGDKHLALYDLVRDPGEEHAITEGIEPSILEHLEALHVLECGGQHHVL